MEKTDNPTQNSQKRLRKVKQDCVFGTKKRQGVLKSEFSDNKYADPGYEGLTYERFYFTHL